MVAGIREISGRILIFDTLSASTSAKWSFIKSSRAREDAGEDPVSIKSRRGREMTGITEEDAGGFPGSAFGFILERQQMAGQAGSVQQFHGESVASRSLFCSLPMGHEFENNRNYDDWALRTIADRSP
ncbi:hypothetical protein K0M31_020037 [Melipona bicolor]|uniref:Uncharacterized protein n=1 Tax=Melipona bicolor TaxID=60889 RepID=A0AA40G0N3_9HYME|nr:hypothetical protein K0M31_020037 [Melipona bicolor]